jgi:SAM-dependent methyltransferase
VSVFSDVDASPQPEVALRYLDDTDEFMSAFKAYIVAVMKRYVPGGRVLDLGCGVGHDLARLTAAGLDAVGVDLSHVALQAACDRSRALVRADGARMPFRDGSFDGCRVERVLQHVPDPGELVAEMLRVVRPGGVLAILEPDHTSLRIESDVDPDGLLLGKLALARHPSVGTRLADLLAQHGCRVDDVIVEHSFGYELAGLPIKAEGALARGVAAGRITDDMRTSWLAEQAERDAAGAFRASWRKILVVARTTGYSGQMRGMRLTGPN